MSDGPYEDAERLELSIDDRVFHRKSGTGRVFGLLNFAEDGSFTLIRNSDEFDVSDIEPRLIQVIQELITSSEGHQWIIYMSIPVVLFDHRNPNNKPLIIIDPLSLFVSKGCLRSRFGLNANYDSFILSAFDDTQEPDSKKKICVDDGVKIDNVESDRSFSVFAVNHYTGRILLEDENANRLIVRAKDVTKVPSHDHDLTIIWPF